MRGEPSHAPQQTHPAHVGSSSGVDRLLACSVRAGAGRGGDAMSHDKHGSGEPDGKLPIVRLQHAREGE